MANYRIISADKAEERFSIADEIWYPYQEFADEQEIRLYTGDVVIDGDLTTDPNENWCPFNIVVDGNLIIRGNLDWHEYGGGCFLWVTGDLGAKAIYASGCPSIYVGGDLVSEQGILTSSGDDGGVLMVEGTLRAPFLISVLYFNLDLMGPVETLLLADSNSTNIPVDFDEYEAGTVLVPEAMVDLDEVDISALWEMIDAGKNPFLATAKPRHILAEERLEALREDAPSVKEIDLSDHGLRGLPTQLFDFPNLKKLNIANNTINELPPDIDRLANLEVLVLSGNTIRELPEGLTRMNLRVLDLSNTRVETLPETFGDLTTLEELSLAKCPASLPKSFRDLSNLKSLDLSSPVGGTQDIPEEVFSLTNLRQLSLDHACWTEIPEALLQLQNLEELNLRTALGGITTLPDLPSLPALKTLRLSGQRHRSRPYPPQSLVPVALGCSGLEELELNIWGPKEPQRGDLLLEPDAFSQLKKLRTLDLRSNYLTSLPESFFELKNLEEVDLRYNCLDRSTMDRIAEAFSKVHFDLRENRREEEDITDPHLLAVKERTKEGSSALGSGRYEEAISTFKEVLSMCTPGKVYTDYDELYATYGIVYSLTHWIAGLPEGEERCRSVEEAIKWSKKALSLVPDFSMIWHYTDEGAFQREVTRIAGNALGWHLHEDPTTEADLEEARTAIARAVTCVDSPSQWFIYDTQVRVLLKSGNYDEAYRIVAQILHQDPDFHDFQDLKNDPGYRAWADENLQVSSQ